MPEQTTDKKIFKRGDPIQVVLADGSLANGTLIDVSKDLKATVDFVHRGLPVRITSSSFDPEGKRPDSWCGAAAVEESK